MEERISIAPFRLDHIDPMQALVAEEDVCVPLSFEYPYPSDGAERYIRWRIDDFKREQSFSFAILRGQLFIGGCSLHTFSIDRKSAEVAFWLGKPYWGCGYARRAVEILIQFAFGRCRLETLLARTLETNQNCMKLLKRLGFLFKKIELQYRCTWPKGVKVHLFELPQIRWRRLRCEQSIERKGSPRKGRVLPLHRCDWVVAPLKAASSYSERSMFGFRMSSIHGRLVLILAACGELCQGLLLPTECTQHADLQRAFPGLKPHPKIKQCLYLPDAIEGFETIATVLVDRIAGNDRRFGVISCDKDDGWYLAALSQKLGSFSEGRPRKQWRDERDSNPRPPA